MTDQAIQVSGIRKPIKKMDMELNCILMDRNTKGTGGMMSTMVMGYLYMIMVIFMMVIFSMGWLLDMGY